MKIIHGRDAGLESERRSDTFTGGVWGDPVLAGIPGTTVNSVFFEPRGRTYWHRHEGGQILVATSGQGKVFSRDGTSATIRAGDTVWIPPGEEHWHGGGPGSYLVHLAISLGAVEWLDEVTDEEYAAA
jgi:quercetin dioxygenase-like cupin family protein